jgi:hypothetical protein
VLVCRVGSQRSAGDAGVGSGCCRLGLFHRRSRSRVRRYPSDITDGQWSVIDPLLPDPASLHGDGRPEEWCRGDSRAIHRAWQAPLLTGQHRSHR